MKIVAALTKNLLTPNVLTTAHVDFVRLALAARAYDTGAAVVAATPVHSVAAGTSPRDALLFHYYGGLLSCGAESWAQAAGLFKTVRC